MYLRHLLNSNNLFQHANDWLLKLEEQKTRSSLFYRATIALIQIQKIETLNAQCVNEYNLFANQMQIVDDKIIFHSESFVALLNEIPSLLSSVRIMQDMLLPIIGKELRISVAQSLNAGINKIEKYAIPDEVKEQLKYYWSSEGKLLREYRVLDQHYNNLVSRTFLQIRPNQRMLIEFPDNPEVRNPQKFVYTEGIDGLNYLRSSFLTLHELYEKIAKFFGSKPIEIAKEIEFSQLGEVTPFQNRTLGLVFDKEYKHMEGNSIQINIKGLRINQKEDGRLEFKNCLLDEEKLNEYRERFLLNIKANPPQPPFAKGGERPPATNSKGISSLSLLKRGLSRIFSYLAALLRG